MSARRLKWALTGLLAFAASCQEAEPEPALQPLGDFKPEALACSDAAGAALFERRIKPLLEPDRPASCQRCHLPGIDLSLAIAGQDDCDRLACLDEQGLVDLKDPRASKLLDWIARGHGADAASTSALARQEYEAVATWLDFGARCQVPTCTPSADPCRYGLPTPDMSGDLDLGDGVDMAVDMAPPPPPPPLDKESYGCEPPQLTAAFTDHIWPDRGRCQHCHAAGPNGNMIPGMPLVWMSARKDEVGAAQTVELIFEYKQRLLDLEEPSKSLLLLKPLALSLGGVEHSGGPKFTKADDETYWAMLSWIKLVAQCEPSP